MWQLQVGQVYWFPMYGYVQLIQKHMSAVGVYMF